MREVIICLSVYFGCLASMSYLSRETPTVPTPVICTESKDYRGASKDGPQTISIDCTPSPVSAPRAPKVEK